MSCDNNSIETHIREAVRFVDGEGLCAAIVANEVDQDGGLTCDAPPLLTQLLMAFAGGGMNTTATTGDPIDCEAPPLNTLLMGAIATSGDGRTLMVVPVEAEGCMSCVESELPTSELIRRTIVQTATGYAVQVAQSDAANPIECGDEYGTETLLRSALVDVGDGTYAWRVTEGGGDAFVCVGEGMLSFNAIAVLEESGCVVETSTTHAVRRHMETAETLLAEWSEYHPWPGVGPYCLYASDAEGEFGGQMIRLGISGLVPDLIESVGLPHLTHFYMDNDSLINVENTTVRINSFTLPPCPALEYLSLQLPLDGSCDISGAGPSLNHFQLNGRQDVNEVVGLVLPAAHVLSYVYFDSCAFDEATVDTLANSLDAGISAGTVGMVGDASDPPSAASTVNRQALYDNGWTLPTSWQWDLVL